MLRIGVFDDEPTHLNYICNLINEELKKRDVIFEIDNFNDLSYFQTKLDSHEMNYDVLFWDIQVKEGTSLQLARDIYKVYPNIKMVYVTNYEFYFKDVFDSNVLYFVRKSDLEKRIEAIVDKILNIYSKQKLYIMNKDCIHIVDLQDVLYIERELRVTYIKCKENIHYKNGEKLKDIFLKLNKRFVRIHNSFIVNIDYIEKVTRTSVVLKNGDTLPVSRKYHLKLKDTIFEN